MPARTAVVTKKLSEIYELLKDQAAHDAKAAEVGNLLIRLAQTSLDFLSRCTQDSLISRVPGKAYFSFVTHGRGGKMSRAVNRELFDHNCLNKLRHVADGTLARMPPVERGRLLYTVAMSYCCAADLLKTRDQKTPATFFECMIGHLIARAFGVNPRTQVEVLRLEEESSTLPTDFIFDLGSAKPKFHVPVKTSTRERVIQVFAHQRVLDGVHGFGKFKGILVCLAETKLDHKSREVIEICVPKQWNLYQRFIAPMRRFYYFDIPKKYGELVEGEPPMSVVNFSKFFDEAADLAVGR
ncbi:MAG: hypothetical protein HY922_02715 [Elusimicrobia bacterium]|nr:hypothetical protein [Elusimicrobiota bacterium]